MTRETSCSIVLPTFDRAPLLGQAIESVLAQTAAAWELLVVDDGSTDDTPRVVERYADPRIRYVREPHRGRSAARNRGVELARFDLVGFLDSDDRLLPEALVAHVQALDARPAAAMTVGGYERIDEAGRVMGVRRPWEEGGELTLQGWLFNCFGMPGTTVIRRAWLERVGAFRPEYSHAEDWDLYLRLAAAGCPMTWVRQSVCQYRDHEGSSTRALDDHLRGIESVLADLSASPGCPLDLRPQMPRALARAYADSARAAVQRGEDDHARRALRLARETGAFTTWLRERLSASPEGFEALLEPIAAGQASRLIAAEDLSRAAGRWGVTPRELRRALARVEMKAFFASLTTGDRAETKSHLLAGLRRDPRWLVNRGVVGFLFGRPPREG